MKKCTLLFFFCFFVTNLAAQSRTNIETLSIDPRGEVEVTLCSQNLKNYGIYQDWKEREAKSKDYYSDKQRALIGRFQYAKCDIIAVQELLGKDQIRARDALNEFAKVIRQQTGRVFEARVSDDDDGPTRLGFLVATDRGEIVNTTTYRKVNLPKLEEDQKPRQFNRAPLEVQVLVKGKGNAASKTIGVITFHSKSKSGSKGDPAALQWETARMEMAEGLRRIIEDRYKSSFSFSEVPLVVLGDRNANFDSASARILEGVVTLDNFKTKGICRLSKTGRPLCQGGNQTEQKLFSVLTEDPETKNQQGTYVYRKEFSWLDDILMPQGSLAFARVNPSQEGNYDSGVVNGYPEASDHALVYVRLNW